MPGFFYRKHCTQVFPLNIRPSITLPYELFDFNFETNAKSEKGVVHKFCHAWQALLATSIYHHTLSSRTRFTRILARHAVFGRCFSVVWPRVTLKVYCSKPRHALNSSQIYLKPRHARSSSQIYPSPLVTRDGLYERPLTIMRYPLFPSQAWRTLWTAPNNHASFFFQIWNERKKVNNNHTV